MKNDINEDYVSFQVAKLLKEKGFSAYCTSLYTEEGKQNDVGNYNGTDDDKYISYSRPTHALAIKWIRENFGIHITSQQIWYSKNTKIAYFYLIYKNPEEDLGNHEDRFAEILEGSYQEVKGNYVNDEKYDKLLFDTKFAFNSPEQAVEAALLYTLKNLIP